MMAPGHSQCWLMITSEGSWERLVRNGAWAFASKAERLARSIREGDEGVVYLTAGKGAVGRIAAVVRFGSPLRKAEPRQLFDKLYPFKLPMTVEQRLSEPIEFVGLVRDLEFVKQKEIWGNYLQGHPARLLSERDANLIKRTMGGRK